MINESLTNKLREKYSPPSSALRRDQLKLVSMLRIVDEIFQKNKIQYWLSSGTLLGCARHEGFIPWDDDLDIICLKKDYKKISRILERYQSDDYVFHDMRTDVDYVNLFGKFRDKRGHIQSLSPRYKYYKYAGIGLDVFAIEKTSYLAALLADKIYNYSMKSTLFFSNDRLRHIYTRVLEFLLLNGIIPIIRLLGLINPKSEYHLALGTGWPKHVFYENEIFPLKAGLFEGFFFPIPNDTERYLTNIYGNWREIPSVESIDSSIHCLEYRREIFGC